jgi:DNA gyrase inhibitor GyrI
MTVPVETSETESAVRMRFFLPAKYTLRTAPEPVDPRVRLIEIPEETIATLRYAGSGSDFSTYQSNLIAKLARSRWRPSGTPYTLYYDAPFTIPFFRRNEAAVEVREELPTDARH